MRNIQRNIYCWMVWVTIIGFWFKHCRCFEANLDLSYLSQNYTQQMTESIPSSWTTDRPSQRTGLIYPTHRIPEDKTTSESNSISHKPPRHKGLISPTLSISGDITTSEPTFSNSISHKPSLHKELISPTYRTPKDKTTSESNSIPHKPSQHKGFISPTLNVQTISHKPEDIATSESISISHKPSQHKGLISPTLSTPEDKTISEPTSSNSISHRLETTPVDTKSLNTDSVSPTLASIYTSYFKDQSQKITRGTERTRTKEDSSVKSISKDWLETQKFHYVTLQPSENEILKSTGTKSSEFYDRTSSSLDGIISSSGKIRYDKDHTLLLSSHMYIYSDILSAQEKAMEDSISSASHPILSFEDKDAALSPSLSSPLSLSLKMLSVQPNSISAEISYKEVQTMDLTTNLYSPISQETMIPLINPSLSYSSIATSETQVKEINVSPVVISHSRDVLFPPLQEKESFRDITHSKSLSTNNEPQPLMSDELTTYQDEQMSLALFKKTKDQFQSTEPRISHTSVNHFVSETQETPNPNLISSSDAESDLVSIFTSFEKPRTMYLRALNTRIHTESIKRDLSELSTTATGDIEYMSSIENLQHMPSSSSSSSSNSPYIQSPASYSTSLLLKHFNKLSLPQKTKIEMKQSANNLFDERMPSVSSDVWETSILNHTSFYLADNDTHLHPVTSLYPEKSYLFDSKRSTEYDSFSYSSQFLSDTSGISIIPSHSTLRVESKTDILESLSITNRNGEYSLDEILIPESSMLSVYSYEQSTRVSSSFGLMSTETLLTSLSTWSSIDLSQTSYLNPTSVQENGNKYYSMEPHLTLSQTESYPAVNSTLRFNSPKTIDSDIHNHNSLFTSSENLQSMYHGTSSTETILEIEQRTVQSEDDTLSTSLFQYQYSTIQSSYFNSVPDHWDFQIHATTPLFSSSDKSAAESLSRTFKTGEKVYEVLSKQIQEEITSTSSPYISLPSSQTQMFISSRSERHNNWSQNETFKNDNASQYESWNQKNYNQSESKFLNFMTSRNKSAMLEFTSSTQYFRNNARTNYDQSLSHSITSRPVPISSPNSHADFPQTSTSSVKSAHVPQTTETILTSSLYHLDSEFSYSLSEFNTIRSTNFVSEVYNTKEIPLEQTLEGVAVYETSTATSPVDPHPQFSTTGGETTIPNLTFLTDTLTTSSHGIIFSTENSTKNVDTSSVPPFENTRMKYAINESSTMSLQTSVELNVPHSSRNLMLKRGDLSSSIPGQRTTEHVLGPSVMESSTNSIIQSLEMRIHDGSPVISTSIQFQQNIESLSSTSKISSIEDSVVEFTKPPMSYSVIDATVEDSIVTSQIDIDSSSNRHTSSKHLLSDFSETNTAALSHQNFESVSPIFETSSQKDYNSEIIKVSTGDLVTDASYKDSTIMSLDEFDSTFIQHTSELTPVMETSSIDKTQLSTSSFSTRIIPLSTRASSFLLISSSRLGTSFPSDDVHSKLPFYSERQSDLETILPSAKKVSSRNEKIDASILSVPETSKQRTIMHTQYISSPESESMQEETEISVDIFFPVSVPAILPTTTTGLKMTRSTLYAGVFSPTVKTDTFSTLEQFKIKSETDTASLKGEVIYSSVSSEIDIFPSPSVFAVQSTSMVVYPFPEINLLVIEINVKIGNDVSNDNFKVKLEEGLTTIYIEGLQDRRKRYSLNDSSGKEVGIKVKIKEIKRKFGERVEVIFLVTYNGIVVSASLAEMTFQKMSDVEMSAILGYPVVVPVSRLTLSSTPPSEPGEWEELLSPLVIVLIAVPTSIVLISSIIAIVIQCRSKSAHRHPSVPRQMESLYKHNLVVDVENGDVRNRRISYEYPSDDEYSMASSDVFNEIKSKYSQSMHSKIKNFEKLNIKNHFHNQLERKPSDALTNKVKFSVSGEENKTNCVQTDRQESNDSGVSCNEQKSPTGVPDNPISKMEGVPQMTCTNTAHVVQNHKCGQNNLQIPPGSIALQNPYPVKNKTNLVKLSSERVTSWVFMGDSPGDGNGGVSREMPENREIHDKVLESDTTVQINQDLNYIPSKCDSQCQTSNQNTYSGVQDHIYETLSKKESKKSDQSTETDSQPEINGSDGFEYLEPLRKLLMAVEQHRRRVPPVDQFLNQENKLQNCVHGFCNLEQCPANPLPSTASSQSGNTHHISFPEESTRKCSCESKRLENYSVSVPDCGVQKALESNDDVCKERQLVKNLETHSESSTHTQNSVQSDSSTESCVYDQPVLSFVGFTSTVEI